MACEVVMWTTIEVACWRWEPLCSFNAQNTPLPKHSSTLSVEHLTCGSHLPFRRSNENHWAVHHLTVTTDHGFCCPLNRH